MAAIYSVRMLAGQATPTQVLSTVVPPSVVWVVRSISVVASTTGVSSFAAYVNGVGYIFGGGALPMSSYSEWDGRQVINGGEMLSCNSMGGNSWFYISGYQLQ